MGAEVEERWGTWEELILGGAVLRYGTNDWDLVASELRTRTRSICPFTFTPEVCKAKYEDLRRRYSNSSALFEELRKQRIAELRQALEKSEDSIGSLESKLETLKAEGRDDWQIDYNCGQTELIVPLPKSDGIYSSSKESKDRISAGSHTQQTGTNWLSEPQRPSSSPAEVVEIKQELSTSPEQEKVPDVVKFGETIFGQGVCLKRRRGKRKRKDCNTDVKEGSVESELVEPTDGLSATRCKDNSASSSGQTAGCFGLDDPDRSSSRDGTSCLMEIFESFMEHKCACVFRKRLDSQKRGRYKKMIMQHMDLDTIRSRIDNRSITTVKQLFRDLLLLANNALVFYSKNTREYKSAFFLRELVTKSLRQHLQNYISKSTIALLSTSSFLLDTPITLPSTRPGNPKVSRVAPKSGKAMAKTPNTAKKQSSSSPLATKSLSSNMKGSRLPKQSGRANTTKLPQMATTRGRKRTRGK